jgi:hypothetical protein
MEISEEELCTISATPEKAKGAIKRIGTRPAVYGIEEEPKIPSNIPAGSDMERKLALRLAAQKYEQMSAVEKSNDIRYSSAAIEHIAKQIIQGRNKSTDGCEENSNPWPNADKKSALPQIYLKTV